MNKGTFKVFVFLGGLLPLGLAAPNAHAADAIKPYRLCGTVGAEQLAQIAAEDVAFAVELNNTPLSAEYKFVVYDSVDRHSRVLRSIPESTKICVLSTLKKGLGGNKAMLISVFHIDR